MAEAILTQAAGQAAGSLVGPAVEGGKGIFNFLKRKYNHVKNMSVNLAKLEKEYAYICAKVVDIEKELELNKQKMEKTEECKIWLGEVQRIKDLNIEKLKTDCQTTHRFFCGLCPFPTLLKLGKQIEKMNEDIVFLNNKVKDIKIMTKKPAPRYQKKHAEKIDKFPSLFQHVDMLKRYLEIEELKRICIWGPAGVGKTTILKTLHNSVGQSGDFNPMLWVTVADGNIRDIQEVLLKRLNLEAEDSNEQRADLISEELENKRYVLFLDEVISEINLKEIGIHDDHKHGKVVFASRNKKLCGLTDEEIEVQRLSDEDAQNLFWEAVGGNLKDNGDIKKVAKQIINECGGMPLLLKIMGTGLAKVQELAIWRDRLSQIRSPDMEQKQQLEAVYKILKLECDKLGSIERACFLYMAIFPACYELHQDYVIDCWRAEHQHLMNLTKLGEARDRGLAILNELVQKSLLESGKKVAHYKIFDHFRRVACRLANHYEKQTIYIQDGESNREIEWEDAKRISLVHMCLSTLPEKPNCGEILTLLVQESSLEEFPESFFESMSKLHLLDLRGTKIRSLPFSISSLKNLRALFLNKCPQLVHLPSELGGLCKLEILDIRDTGIHSLPMQIRDLRYLKCLRVSFMENVGNANHVDTRPREMISSDTIGRLCLLEELSIYVEPNSSRWGQNARNVAMEVAALENLTTLLFYFPEVECLQTFINASKSWNGNNTLEERNSFRSFSILVGNHQRSVSCAKFDVSGCSDEKHLRFSLGEGFPDAVLKILEQANSFELVGHHDAANLSCFGADNLKGLTACTIENCREMTSIIDGNQAGDAFECLNKLCINNLPKLEHIWKGSIESASLKKLTTLTLKGCHSVETLFSLGMVLRLEQLHYLQVEDCPLIEEFIEAGSEGELGIFPKLKNLELIHLPRLSNIVSNVSLTWSCLETIMIDKCELLTNFPSTFKEAAKLRMIKCTQDLWNQLVWPNDTVRDRFQRLHQPI